MQIINMDNKAIENFKNELKEYGKPFIVVLNSLHPNSSETIKLSEEMRNNYNVPVLPISVEKMNEKEIYEILSYIDKQAVMKIPENLLIKINEMRNKNYKNRRWYISI